MSAEPRQHYSVVNDAEISWFEWGRPGDPVVLLAHATGFHARCWDQVVRHLDASHVIAVDHRGHGRSSKLPPYTFAQFGADLSALIETLGLQDITAVGHSMGGHCIVQAVANHASRCNRVVLFDPVIFSPSLYANAPSMEDFEHPTAKRRNQFISPQQLFDSYKDRLPFSRWNTEVLRDYCEYGLMPADDGYQLACPPAVEASIYLAATGMSLHEQIHSIDLPVTVVRAEPRGLEAALSDFSASPTWPELADAFSQGEDRYLPEYSHFMPMENPLLAAKIIGGD